MKTLHSFFSSNRIEPVLAFSLLIISSLCFLGPADWPRFSIALISCLLTALWGIIFQYWKLSSRDGVALGCAAVFLLYHRWTEVSFGTAVKHGLSLFLIWTVFFVFSRLKRPSFYAPLAAVLILMAGILFQALWPEAHFQFMQQSGYDYGVKNSRGFSSFTSEPSALAMIAVGFFALTFYCRGQTRWQKPAAVFGAVLLTLLSRSWTGFLLLAFVLFCLCCVQFRNVLKMLPAILLAAGCVLIIPVPHAQSGSFVRKSTGTGPFAGLLADRSLMCRWYPLLMGVLHGVEHPWGNGESRLREADFSRLSLKYNVGQRLDAALAALGASAEKREEVGLFCQKIQRMNEGVTGRFFAVGLFRMGIFFPLCFTLFLWGLGLFHWRVLPVLAWLIACAAMTAGVIMPVFWMIAGSTQASIRQKNDESSVLL